ncbi:putative bifunctional diguanylate cyclase/phosphodiesterase [Salinisphaera sp.]|uniref:putative bifunctional diguanylate cyclase/phosphodiesterase n=1 Tax=Salinisphaera sp. TaxID=1914330 RepID=UPI002D76FFCB|nr:EAL domain-containing protein [Salinisphaera sp.]HET7314748.1 EAL domain-containing protein [Salinisphaera sp.]
MYTYRSNGDGIDAEQIKALQRLVRSAAHSVDCPWALYYRETDAGLMPEAWFGVTEPAPYESGQVLWRQAGLRPADMLVINDASMESGLPLPDLGRPEAPAIRFLTLVSVKGRDKKILGVLAVADHQPHAGLTAAQTYVLRTHALQVALQADPPQRYRKTDDRQDSATSERLRLLESVVVHANDAVLITEAEPIDLPGPRIVYCNAAFTRTTGYAEAEVLGKTPRILQTEKTNRESLDRLRKALKKWAPIEVELLNTRKDGREFWVELSIVPVADERGWYTHWVSVQRDVTERKQAEEIASRARIAHAENLVLETKLLERQRNEEKLAYAAFHDDLTKLYNRAYVMDRLNAIFRRLRAEQTLEAAILYLDMDRFKLVNDGLGHRAGDLLLMEMARRLESCLRAGDTLARFGGDEFLVLVEGKAHESAAVQLAERITDRLRAPFKLGEQTIFTSSSIGIVNITEDYANAEDLLRDADVAMYAAKAEGTGRYAIFAGPMRDQAMEALALQNDLRQAIAHNEFSLHYQPIYDPLENKLHGAEALIRWHHPERGAVPPNVFIPVAEEIGVIRDISRWVMSEACAQLQVWREQFPEHDLHLNINISATDLKYARFVAELQEVLQATGFPADRLQIEMTESVFLSDPEAVGQVLAAVRGLGVQVALDDFGTGYSALEYIDKYEIDAIKIDRTFVWRMLTHKRTMAIVESILSLGRTLGLDIVAEGVETWAQYDMLHTMRCPYVQGFLFWRPMPPPEMDAFLDAARDRIRFDSPSR